MPFSIGDLPNLVFSPKGPVSERLNLKQKPMQADIFRMAKDNRSWRKVAIRDSSKSLIVAEYLHERVWLWGHENENQPIRCHLIIRRNRTRSGTGWQYKYSLSNAPAQTGIEILAYQQAQQFWVEQAIRDAKDSLGLDEYQARKWRSWHHHVALTMLAGLYVLKVRLEHRRDIPMLSIANIKALLAILLPEKVRTIKDLWHEINNRHRRRRQAYASASRCWDPIEKSM